MRLSNVKFCYCPKCREMHPKNWHDRNHCPQCGEECAVIQVRTSIFGYLMYLFSAAAVVLIALRLMDHKWMASGLSVAMIFVMIIIAFVFTFAEIGRGTKQAYRQMKQ